jgi:hypothetical protein
LSITDRQPGWQAQAHHLIQMQCEKLVCIQPHRCSQTHIVGTAVENLTTSSEAYQSKRQVRSQADCYVLKLLLLRNDLLQQHKSTKAEDLHSFFIALLHALLKESPT